MTAKSIDPHAGANADDGEEEMQKTETKVKILMPEECDSGDGSKNVKFRRNSIIEQIFLEREPGPLPETDPDRSSLKTYDKEDIPIDEDIFKGNDSKHSQYDQSRDTRGEFLAGYGLSDVMMSRVISNCSTIFDTTVLLDNGPWMKRRDVQCIQGQRNTISRSRLTAENRMANNSDFNLGLSSCQRIEALKDISFFLIHLAASMGVPTSFEVLSSVKKGKGRGFRRIGSTTQDESQKTAEDYIPISNQVESALELVVNFAACLETVPDGCLKQIEGVKKYCEEKHVEIEKQGGNLLVIIITSVYPWGANESDKDDDTKKIVALLNDFTDHPVTFVFLVECRSPAIVQFYDKLTLPENGVKADVKIAKELGLMIDGIQKHNSWLNYCLPMHLCQAIGIGSNILSQAASRPLSPAEIGELCKTFIGDVPDPDDDSDSFLGAIEDSLSSNGHTNWNPVTGTYDPLVDIVQLRKRFPQKSAGCCDWLFGKK